MTQPVSSRDARFLSEYIDGQLKPGPRARLEARLEVEAGLRQALDDMARTCRLLRSQEPLHVPRSFILTPAMVGGRKPAPPPTYPVFGLVSAMATVLLILVLAGDWLSARGLFSGALSGGAPDQVVMMGAPVEAEAQPAFEMAVEAQVTATPEMLLESAPPEQPAPSAKSMTETTADENARNMAPEGESGPAASLMGAAQAETGEAAGMGAAESLDTYPTPEIYPYPEMSGKTAALFGMPRPLLTILEFLLAVAAVVFLVLFVAWRRRAF
jgi:hypothetical protein